MQDRGDFAKMTGASRDGTMRAAAVASNPAGGAGGAEPVAGALGAGAGVSRAGVKTARINAASPSKPRS